MSPSCSLMHPQSAASRISMASRWQARMPRERRAQVAGQSQIAHLFANFSVKNPETASDSSLFAFYGNTEMYCSILSVFTNF